MTLEETAKKFGFTKKSLYILIGLGVIRKDPIEEDMIFLSLLSRIWKNGIWLRESLKQIRSKTRREKLVRELELTKPERYVLNRYLNAEKRLSAQKITEEVAYYFGMPKNVALPMVRRMRGRASSARYRRKLEVSSPDGKPHKS